jgi:hypothetical protein
MCGSSIAPAPGVRVQQAMQVEQDSSCCRPCCWGSVVCFVLAGSSAVVARAKSWNCRRDVCSEHCACVPLVSAVPEWSLLFVLAVGAT